MLTFVYAVVGFFCFALIIHGYRKTFYHFLTVDPGQLYRSGCLNPFSLFVITKLYGIDTIINLRTEKERPEHNWLAREVNFCQKHNIDLINIPLPMDNPPEPDQVKQFLEVSTNPSKVCLVHCEMGAIRTGMMVVVYAKNRLQATEEECMTTYLPRFNHNLAKRPQVGVFIRNYQPDPEFLKTAT